MIWKVENKNQTTQDANNALLAQVYISPSPGAIILCPKPPLNDKRVNFSANKKISKLSKKLLGKFEANFVLE